MIAASMLPGVGEAMNLHVLFASGSSFWDRAAAGLSLGANIITGGAAPNYGAYKRAAKEVASILNDGASVIAQGATRVTGSALKEFDRVVRPAYWKEYARQIDGGLIGNPFSGAENLARMRRGRAPIGPDGRSVNLHHVHPLSYGGTNAFDNLVPINATTHQRLYGVLHSPPFP